MAAFLGWLSAHPDVLGIAAFVLTSVIARYAPNTPFWIGVRAWVTDYANKNAKALPSTLTAQLQYDAEPGAILVLSVDGAEVKRLRVSL